MEVRTPSPLPLQPGMDTGFDPPGQPAPPQPVTGGGARVLQPITLNKICTGSMLSWLEPSSASQLSITAFTC